ncbi:MAG TPA: hypothetical protein VGF48_25865 [Thermoanaerobaculia bacterium]|jgi:hypothetical protein
MRRLTILLLAALPLFGQSSPEDLIPNSVKYKDSGLKPVSGRSGSASVEARALLGRDGGTNIEITTGSFESNAAGAGSIDRVQIKQNAGSDEAGTQNVETSGSFVSIPVTGLVWREPIQLQARVSGIDPNRADVVTVTESVKLRPHLILDPTAPLHALAGVPYSVDAVIFEVNRDLGARATCVMRVDGVEVDRAENIWIDAGGRVTCHMLHTFDTPGVQNVEYALIGVSPAPWDPSRTVARTTVNVYASAVEMTTWDTTTVERIEETTSSSSGVADDFYEGGEGYEKIIGQRTQFSAMIAGTFDLSQLAASFYERTDGGQPIYEVPVAGFYPGGPWITDGCKFSDRRYAYMTVCSNNGLTNITYSRMSAEVTYISKAWQYWLRPDGTWAGFSYVISMPRRQNWKQEYGDTLSLEFRVSDGTSLWEAAPTMQPVTEGPETTARSGCYGWVPTCWTSTKTVTTRSGSASHPQ